MTCRHEAILVFRDLFSTTSRGDDVQRFDTRWDEGFLVNPRSSFGQKSGEPIHVLVRESDQLQSVLAFFEQDIEMENTQPSYERLKKHGENISQSEDESPKF